MIKEFLQKRGLNTRKYSLYDEKIVVETKTLSKIEKYEIKIENIGTELFYHSDNNTSRKVNIVISLIIPIILLGIKYYLPNNIDVGSIVITFIVCWIYALVNYLKQYEDDIYLKGTQNIVFYRNFPSEKLVLEFIDLITQTSKNYFKKKYYKYDEHLTESEFYNIMKWLLDREIITNFEFEKIMTEYQTKKIL